MDFDKTYKMLLRSFRSRENGPASDKLKTLGYKRNFGVSVTEIKQIVTGTYAKNQEFANYLINKDLREAKIAAMHFAEAKKMTDKIANEWINKLTNNELVEQACMHLLPHIPEVYEHVNKWTKSRQEFVPHTAFLLLARLAMTDKEADNQQFIFFLPHLLAAITKSGLHVRRAISLAFRKIGRRNNELRKIIIETLEKLPNSEQEIGWIVNDVFLELREFEN